MTAARGAGALPLRLAAWLAPGLAAIGAIACNRPPSLAFPQRLALLRFEDLGSGPGHNWMGRALQEILDAELAGSPELYAIPSSRLLSMDRALGARPVSAPGISAGQAAAISLGATRIGYGSFSTRSGRLDLQLTLMDPITGKVAAALEAEAGEGDLVAAATALAHQISPRASGYSTHNQAAMHAYVAALEASSPADAATEAAAAHEADAGFGPAARLLATLRLEQGDRAGALKYLNEALARGAQLPGDERARLRVDIAALGNQPVARQEALTGMAAAEPANPEAWMALAGFAFARRDYATAQTAYHNAAELDPAPIAALNEGAYAAAYGGHLQEAVSALRRCQALRPADPNSLDSLGDVQMISGHPHEAETFYLLAAKQDPHFLNGGDWLKAAMARLSTGDRAGADQLSERYAQERFTGQDPAADLYRAQWLFLSGRRREGLRDLEALSQRPGAGPARALAGEAHTQLAIWSLYLGDRTAAQGHARAALGRTPSAILGAFLAAPPASANEWIARAEKLAPHPVQADAVDFVLGQALLLGKQFDAAVPVLQRALESAAPTNAEIPVLLAWAYLETGRIAEANSLLAFNPIPPATGISLFASCCFPRIYFLRGRAAEKQGRADVARANYKLFVELSGDEPFQWGEEQAARSRLGAEQTR